MQIVLPNIAFENFILTRNTIHLYSQLIGFIKSSLVPHNKNWEEHALQVYTKGFTTGVMPVIENENYCALELNITLVEHKLKIFYKNIRDEIDLEQSSIKSFTQLLLSKLESYGITIESVNEKFFMNSKLFYDRSEIENIWNLTRPIYFILHKFKSSLLLETSNINFWPHHFDLALLVFSGNTIDDKDNSKWDSSREQMNFGFSYGDSEFNEPYFYITSYPSDHSLFEIDLPYIASKHNSSWKGILIKLSDLKDNTINEEVLLNIFNELIKNRFKSLQ